MLNNEFFNDDALRDYLNIIREYPLLSKEENNRLALLAQQGDKVSREKLINCNLRLVIYIAKRHCKNLNHLKLLDLIQEGTLGLIKSIETFDFEKGNFSTHASNNISGTIKRAIANKELEIRFPANTCIRINYLKRIIAESNLLGTDIPTDEELCRTLNVSRDLLCDLKRICGYNIISMNQKVNVDKSMGDVGTEESVEIFLGEEDNYSDIDQKIDNQNLLIILKHVLNHEQYYVLYHRYLFSNQRTQDAIGSDFFVTRERIRIIEEKAKRIAKAYLIEDSQLYKLEYNKIIKGYKTEWYNPSPIDPKKIVLFLYIQDELSSIERQLLYYKFFGKFIIDIYLNQMGISKEEFMQIETSIKEKIQSIYQKPEEYRQFNNGLLSTHKTQIYKLYEQIEVIDMKRS